MQQSYGIFVENPKNVVIAGTEFLQNVPRDNRARGVVNTNRIGRDRILNKWVLIISGTFKGQKGLVTHVNGDTITLETSIRAKKIHIQRSELRELNQDEMNPESNSKHQTYGGGETVY